MKARGRARTRKEIERHQECASREGERDNKGFKKKEVCMRERGAKGQVGGGG